MTESPLLLMALNTEHFSEHSLHFLRRSLELPSKIPNPVTSPSQPSITELLHGPSADGSLLLQVK